MRLIDADALIEILAVMQGRCTTKGALVHNSKIWQQVKDMPTVDAVPVIRCKDCENFDTGTGKKGYYFCPMLDTFRRPEGYCDLAEEKDNG